MWTSPRSNTVCVFCEKSFQNNGQMRRHLLIHTGERPFRCRSCNYAANQFIHLKTHCMRVHSGDESSYCQSDSDEDTDTGYDMSYLFDISKSPEEPSPSSVGDLTIADESTKTPKQRDSDLLGPKILFRVGQTPVQSNDFGGKDFEVPRSMLHEMKTPGTLDALAGIDRTGNETTGSSKCEEKIDLVNKLDSSDSSDQLKQHAHSNEDFDQSFTVSSAPSTPSLHSVTKRKLSEEIQVVPAKKPRAQSMGSFDEDDELDSDNAIKCEDCDYSCDYWRTMTAHIKKVHRTMDLNEATIKCLQCDQLFKSHFALNIHEKRMHSANKPYKCKYCDFASVSKQYCVRHERYQHSPSSVAAGMRTRNFREVAETSMMSSSSETYEVALDESIEQILDKNPITQKITSTVEKPVSHPAQANKDDADDGTIVYLK